MLMMLMLILCQRCHYEKFEHHNFWKIQIRTIQEHIEVWVYKFQLIAAHALNQLCMKHIHIFPRRLYARWLVGWFVRSFNLFFIISHLRNIRWMGCFRLFCLFSIKICWIMIYHPFVSIQRWVYLAIYDTWMKNKHIRTYIYADNSTQFF